jgi:ubiquitin-protein ligase
MTTRKEKRILNEIKELNNDASILANSGIYFYCDESNINNVYALLIGTSDTPYEKGFYFFKFTYPDTYPMQPPLAKYCTQGKLINPQTNQPYSVRFNPNLYTCGKVCLSMLNTWAGPGWVPTNTMMNVLVAIQAIVLNPDPLINEPGYENAAKKELKMYNNILEYANIKISVCEMITKTPSEFCMFKDILHENFMKNIDFYRNFIKEKKIEFQGATFDSSAYSMKLTPDYDYLLQEIESITLKID